MRGSLGGFVALLAGIVSLSGLAQSPEGQGASSDPNVALGAPAAVHGIVMNAATGEPLSRALVQVNGGTGEAVLTDGDGRFEISGVPLGPSVFQLTKPGFEDAAGSENGGPDGQLLRDLRGFTHNVFVTANTPNLILSMRPTNVIRGQIELSTGDPAQNIGVTLLQRQIQYGRAVWKPANSTRTNADGGYRFAHLDDGDYAVQTVPAAQADLTGRIAAGADRNLQANGYPEMFYPDARDFAGAARIHLSGGETVQANLNLPLEPFQSVTASVVLPPSMRADAGTAVQVEVVGASGSHAPYLSEYQADARTAWAMLPDGTYTLRLTGTNGAGPYSVGHAGRSKPELIGGQTDVTVAGQALNRLRIPVAPMASSPLELSVSRTSAQASSGVGKGTVFVEITPAGPLSDGMQSEFAQGAGPGMLDTTPPAPGRYWVHTVIADASLCEDSFTAGGASLGREPLQVGLGGATAPLSLRLRDDCASLKVSLPPAMVGMTAGEEPSYTVYVVPDRDFTTDAQSRILRASSGSEFTFQALTPGSYHVYAFSAPVELEYHNPNALAGLHGQSITLAPGETGSLVLEVSAR